VLCGLLFLSGSCINSNQFLDLNDARKPSEMTTQESNDFVVVGAGAGGSAAAVRLSESGKYSVLLIEAGRDDPWVWLKIPLGIGVVLTKERALWRNWTQVEPNLNNRKIFWLRGRVLGGTSTVNGMLRVRGDPAEYDAWAAAGCDGWDHHSLLPRFKRMEMAAVGKAAYRGRDGPVGTCNEP
jgi:choline dehydrogenase